MNSCIFSSTQLEVSTTDFAGNLVEGPALLLITVIDQNDNRPIFKETRYAGEVLEGSPTEVIKARVPAVKGERGMDLVCCSAPLSALTHTQAVVFFCCGIMTATCGGRQEPDTASMLEKNLSKLENSLSNTLTGDLLSHNASLSACQPEKAREINAQGS
eukprot:superscaffoldBa00001386_g10328